MAIASLYQVTSFYKFIEMDNIYDMQLVLLKFCNQHDIKGTILIATEGLNGILSGREDSMKSFCQFIHSIKGFEDINFKSSFTPEQPFKRIKVRIKNEIVTFKVADLDMNQVGEYLSAEEWDAMLQKPEVTLIDTRNEYEVAFGTFANAIDPKTINFSDFPAWAEANLANHDHTKPIAMFCTGGVRCEKSTAYLKQKGFKNVYHLKGGILQYLEDSKNKTGLWQGSCFVFDDRLAVTVDLKPIEEI